MKPLDLAGLEEIARAAVRDAWGARVRIDRFDTLQATQASVVLLVTVGGQQPRRLVFKAAGRGASDGTDYARTAAVVDLARSAGAPVAAVLAVDTSYRAGPWQYLLQEHVPGLVWRRVRPLLSDQEVEAVQREIAETVLAIQSVRLDGYGELDHEARGPGGGTVINSLRVRARTRILRADDRRAFLRLLDRDEDLFAAPLGAATLCHDDLHHGNVILDRQDGRCRVTGLLDWDKAWAGPAESDVARMALWDDMTGPAFWRAYRAAVPAAPGHERRALVHQLLWCLEYDDGSARHAADTHNLRRRLGLDG